MQKFFLYARKSTDVEDKQILSIEAQITELREFAKRENLEIVEEFIEKQTAKVPGRPIFNEMLNRIEKGEANGIVSWHPDRLARNSVDGGRIIYLLDCGQITSLKFPQFWFESTPQGKFMLNIAFGQSKYYVDSLSENTKRGLRQKVRRGEFPGPAPIGYINDSRTKTITVDRNKEKIIRKAFELYAEGNSRMEKIAHFLAQNNIKSRSGKLWHDDRVRRFLTNPFYYGHFRYAGEIHEGKHEPIIAKKLFDQVQEIMKQRGRPIKEEAIPKPFLDLMRCATCGMAITGEYKIKTQKNGNIHYYTYYRCTKKRKDIKCPEPCILQEELNTQISSLLQKVSLRKDWAEKMLNKLETEKNESAQSLAAFVQETRKKIAVIQIKLQRLLDGYLEQDIEREDYRMEKAKLMSEKKSLEEQTTRFEQKQNDCLEPMRSWIISASNMEKIARDGNLFAKKVAAKEVFGSNLLLKTKKARGSALPPWSALRADAAFQNWVRDTGIGPVLLAWEASVLPLY